MRRKYMDEKKENLLDYLKKPTGYMSIVMLIITSIVTFGITSYFQEKKEITIQESQYSFLTRNNSKDSEIDQHIQIYYDNKKIYDPHIIEITFTNNGNQTITEEDFQTDNFEISCEENVILYDVSISSTTSKIIADELAPKLEIEDNCLLISPFLLNVGESFTLSLITNQNSELFYNFRISGISNIKKETATYASILTLLLSLCSVIINVLSMIYSKSKKKSPLLNTFFNVVIIIFIVLILAVSISLFSSINAGKTMHQFVFK